MSRTKKFLSGLGLSLMVVALASPALACKGKRGGERLSPERIEKMAEKLNLDEAQIEAVQGIAEASRAEGEALREDIRAARQAVKTEMQAEQPNQAAAMAAVEEVGRLKTEMKKLKVSTMLDIRAQLTPEQAATFRELRAERHERRGKRGKRGKRFRAAE